MTTRGDFLISVTFLSLPPSSPRSNFKKLDASPLHPVSGLESTIFAPHCLADPRLLPERRSSLSSFAFNHTTSQSVSTSLSRTAPCAAYSPGTLADYPPELTSCSRWSPPLLSSLPSPPSDQLLLKASTTRSLSVVPQVSSSLSSGLVSSTRSLPFSRSRGRNVLRS